MPGDDHMPMLQCPRCRTLLKIAEDAPPPVVTCPFCLARVANRTTAATATPRPVLPLDDQAKRDGVAASALIGLIIVMIVVGASLAIYSGATGFEPSLMVLGAVIATIGLGIALHVWTSPPRANEDARRAVAID